MKNLLTLCLSFFLLVFAIHSQAEQKIVDGNYHVHYSVFPSTAIGADVAARYGIVRSKHRALVNITPQFHSENVSKGQKAKVEGKARNLIGNTRTLAFKEFIEGEVVYYLAELPFSNEEHFRFDIQLQPENNPEKIIRIQFDKKFLR